MKITILHLDLGIGGAEQLIVSIATSMQKLGHEVTILTSHHDVNHCFEETKPDGVLGKCIHVYGDWIPRHLFGKFTAFFAIIRMIFLAFIVGFFYRSKSDLVFLDGVSAPIPLLRLFGLRVLFYCHFPDKLLCVDRSNMMKSVYRFFIDGFEELTTACSDLILVNSLFTASMFKSAFHRLGKSVQPQVLYPVINEIPESEVKAIAKRYHEYIPYTEGYDHVFVSLNRYERKKNISLAIDALKHLKTLQKGCIARVKNCKVLLVIAGGYDTRVDENVEYLQELIKHCGSDVSYRYISNLKDEASTSNSGGSFSVNVIFRTSISSSERTALLSRCIGLLYTPDKEHFGIVPLEAMYLRVPVIAVNSGGPRETVLHEQTGYLCEQNAADFGMAMLKLLTEAASDPSEDKKAKVMGQTAREHVVSKFTASVMQQKLQEYITEVTSN